MVKRIFLGDLTAVDWEIVRIQSEKVEESKWSPEEKKKAETPCFLSGGDLKGWCIVMYHCWLILISVGIRARRQNNSSLTSSPRMFSSHLGVSKTTLAIWIQMNPPRVTMSHAARALWLLIPPQLMWVCSKTTTAQVLFQIQNVCRNMRSQKTHSPPLCSVYESQPNGCLFWHDRIGQEAQGSPSLSGRLPVGRVCLVSPWIGTVNKGHLIDVRDANRSSKFITVRLQLTKFRENSLYPRSLSFPACVFILCSAGGLAGVPAKLGSAAIKSARSGWGLLRSMPLSLAGEPF